MDHLNIVHWRKMIWTPWQRSKVSNSVLFFDTSMLMYTYIWGLVCVCHEDFLFVWMPFGWWYYYLVQGLLLLKLSFSPRMIYLFRWRSTMNVKIHTNLLVNKCVCTYVDLGRFCAWIHAYCPQIVSAMHCH